jgi:plastocyanin
MMNKGYVVGMVAAASLAACSDGIQPLAPREAPVAAALTVVSGDDQDGSAGLSFKPFVVRVTDHRGQGIPNVPVTWRLESGVGYLGDNLWEPHTTISTRTNLAGGAQIIFHPTDLGPSTVTASVAESSIPPATFTATAGIMVIFVSPWSWGIFGPNNSADVTVPVGATVEWLVGFDGHILTSSATPSGGQSFRSATLGVNDRFQFVPTVAGTWKYFCEIHESEESGTLTAR